MHRPLARLALSALAAFALSAPLAAQVPVQVADLNTTRYDSGDDFLFRSEFVEFGGAVYFSASDILHGREIWKTDGTEAGTVRLTDLCPGACDSFPRNLTVVGSMLYFSADDGAHGFEPWITDGTTAGTRMILDAVPGLGSSRPNFPRVLGGRVFYAANDPAAGQELWVTDGTTGGTQRLVDINPGAAGSGAIPWQVLGSDLFFAANDGVHGEELWATDGTAAGTRMVLDIFPGVQPSLPGFTPLPGFNRFAALGSRLFFAAADATNDYELWASDGTAAGTTRVADINPGPDGSVPTFFEVLGSILLFKAGGGTNGTELWRTDGTETGTAEVKNIFPGATGSDPYELTRFGSAVYFHAADDVHGRELWKSDGTEAGTSLVADVRPGVDSGLALFFSPHSLTPVGSRLLFFADDGVSGNELWATDGTAAGTAQVADLNPGAAHADGGSFIGGFEFRVVSGGRWHFTVYDGSYLEGRQLYTSDGTAAGTARLKRLVEQRSGVTLPLFGRSLDSRPMTGLASRLIFSGDDGVQGGEPAASDGTPAGTALLLDVNPGVDTSTPGEMIILGSKALFSAWQGTGNRTLYATDGTSIGTVPISVNSQPSYLTPFAGSAYFSAADTAHGAEVWKSDGTPGGTGLAFDLVPGTGHSSPAFFTPLGNKLYFTASDPAAGNELWITDGATATRVADIAPGAAQGFPTQLTPSPNYSTGPVIFFTADDGVHGRELWISDGTAAGTRLVRDLALGPESSIEASPTDSFASASGATMAMLLDSLVVFAAADSPGDEELWASGGGKFPFSTFRLADIHFGPQGSQPRKLTKVGQRIVFVADDGLHGRELWVVNENLIAERLADIFPGARSSVPQHLTGFGGLVLFSADDGTHGREPWVTDGTPAGTRRMADIAPGALPSSPYAFTAVGGNLYFAATDAVSGFELWRVPRSSLGAHVTATKQVSGQFVPGGLVTYTIVLSNAGPGAQLRNSGVQLEDPISPALALQSVSATSGTITHSVPGPQINWSGDIPAGGQVTITMIFRVLPGTPSETVITNQAIVHFDSDGDLIDDTDVPTDDPDHPGAGDATTFRVGLGFYTVPPCRAFDSRPGAPLSNGLTQPVPVHGVCGIPTSAKALSFNLTAIEPSALGFLQVYPTGTTPGTVSQINFGPGQTRSNHGVIEIGADGRLLVGAALTGGAVDFVLDVVGYFE